jgi:hypothetical protein
MSKAEERALEKYPEKIAKCVIFPEAKGVDFNTAKRKAFQEGYEQAEKDILSKFTKEHLEGLKWIERSGITSQPTPYHKYCKDLYKVLEELLKEKYDIQGDTSL